MEEKRVSEPVATADNNFRLSGILYRLRRFAVPTSLKVSSSQPVPAHTALKAPTNHLPSPTYFGKIGCRSNLVHHTEYERPPPRPVVRDGTAEQFGGNRLVRGDPSGVLERERGHG